ncbi:MULTISPECIES: LysR family transcriptional regulator [Streptomyces]|uniref:LysR family transcriptional regulator n=1 Tax=Streptomyces doudnae TaxID=3075536 RepID=A0ABD5EVA4_9ACTN|nr:MULTISPECIES: LysR family transcriptional regulator [unclassified Streptomyces]MDT0438183.1 LysR family transcriptional regulator [Streptomyces sp. DSM 41981]MYQ67732.1 LysR family transcriptional regulator [Streptomyces sp. SID4950]SCE39286.1 transcriptional regulator, LysR family [Streptomyces sp. SolWspMP-5a-2]
MELRELRYFVALAEELHFGRAAQRLGMSQPPLSRAITQLERRLGTVLLERTSRRVALTAAGEVLLAEGRAILGAVTAAERHTRGAAATRPGLVLAVKSGTAGDLLKKLLDAYAAEPGAATVELLLCEAHQHRLAVRDGRADVALLHLPFDSAAGLDTETLFTEGQVAILPAAHPLAARARLRTADVTTLPDLPTARWPDPGGGYPEGPGPEIRNLTQLFQLVALGRTTVVLPASAATDLSPDLAAVPVLDAPLVTTAIAWPPHSRLRTVADLVRVATCL